MGFLILSLDQKAENVEYRPKQKKKKKEEENDTVTESTNGLVL